MLLPVRAAGAGKVYALNGSGRAPAAANIDWYESRQMTVMENTSAHSVTVPGAVNAWETLLKAHGRKGLDELLRPAIRYAEDGWPVHPKVSWDWARSTAKLRKGGSAHFLPDGEAPKAGDVFAQPALAETLRAISRHGAKAFYEGFVPPTSSQRCGRVAACTPRKISPAAYTTLNSSSRLR